MTGRPPVASRDLGLLAGAVFLSAAGDLVALVTLAVHVHALTGSGLWVAALFAAVSVPVVVLAPAAGLLADRVESVRLLVGASLAQAAVAAGLAFATDTALVLLLAAALAAGNAVSQPAEFTLVPAVAGTRGLVHATGVVEAARYAGFAAGPVIAAVVVTAGTRPALIVDAASFAVVALAAGALRARRRPVAGGPRGRGRALDGVRVLGADPVLRVTVATAVGALVFVSVTPTLQVLYVREVLGADPRAYALVVAGWMAGMVAGAAVVARRLPAGLAAPGALVALAVQGAGIAGQTAAPLVGLAFAGFLAGGVGHGVKNVLLRSLLAERVPAAAQGRAFAAYNAGRNAAELTALGVCAALVAVTGPRAGLAVGGGAAVVLAAVGLVACMSTRSPPDAAPDGLSGGRAPRVPARR